MFKSGSEGGGSPAWLCSTQAPMLYTCRGTVSTKSNLPGQQALDIGIGDISLRLVSLRIALNTKPTSSPSIVAITSKGKYSTVISVGLPR